MSPDTDFELIVVDPEPHSALAQHRIIQIVVGHDSELVAIEKLFALMGKGLVPMPTTQAGAEDKEHYVPTFFFGVRP